MDDFFEAYVDAMLWANTFDQDGESLDDGLSRRDDVSDDAMARMREDCASFLAYNVSVDIDGDDVSAADLIADQGPSYGMAQAGHDFALTRNHHGAGFWDRGLDLAGVMLTEAADTFGSASLFVNDDDAIDHL